MKNWQLLNLFIKFLASPAISREEVSDNIPNFTPPSRKIDMVKFQKELADPPGTPDICKNKARVEKSIYFT